MIETFSDAAMDVLQDRILPLILARVGQAVVDPDGWGIVELVVVASVVDEEVLLEEVLDEEVVELVLDEVVLVVLVSVVPKQITP